MIIRLLLAPIVRELHDGVRRLVAIAHERERELTCRIILPAKELHAEQTCVKVNRLLEVQNADHRVEKPEVSGSFIGRCTAGRGGLVIHLVTSPCRLAGVCGAVSAKARPSTTSAAR